MWTQILYCALWNQCSSMPIFLFKSCSLGIHHGLIVFNIGWLLVRLSSGSKCASLGIEFRYCHACYSSFRGRGWIFNVVTRHFLILQIQLVCWLSNLLLSSISKLNVVTLYNLVSGRYQIFILAYFLNVQRVAILWKLWNVLRYQLLLGNHRFHSLLILDRR